MTNEPIIKPLRLIFQGSVTVETAEDAEMFYEQLKEIVRMFDKDCTLNGQVMKMLEPCCKKPPAPAEIGIAKTTKGVPNVNVSQMV